MKKVDAIISSPTTQGFEKLREIQDRHIPIVIVDRQAKDFIADTVRVDYAVGSQEVVDYLINLGHREIGYIDRKIDQSHSVEQRQAFIDALRQKGIAYNPEFTVRANGFDYNSGADAVKQLLKSKPQITAIFAYYDILALGAMRGVRDLGLRVPEDVSIVGCDNMPFTEAVCPRLTTLSFPVQELSQVVCEILIKRLNQDEDHPEPIHDLAMIPKLIMRESTSPVRT